MSLFSDPFFFPRERLISNWTDDLFDDPFFRRPLLLTPFYGLDRNPASAIEPSQAGAANGSAGESQGQQLQNQQQQQQQQLSTRGGLAGGALDRPLGFRVDLSEDKEKYLVHAELPGFKKEDIKVRLDNNSLLTIEAERKDERKGQDDASGLKQHWTERSYGRFVRSFRLPSNTINPEKISANLDNGVLNVTVAKVPVPEKESRHIAVN